MQGDSSRPDEQSLVEHRGFVEALARRLVFDQHLADDLVQETLLAAMRNPPRERKAIDSIVFGATFDSEHPSFG